MTQEGQLDTHGRDLAQHAGFARAIARAILGREDLADDAVQDALAAAWGSKPRHEGRLRSWFGGIVRHKALDIQRREATRLAREHAVAAQSKTDDPAAVAERADMGRRVVEQVLALPEAHRHVLLLRFHSGRTIPEIATLLDVPVETVRTWQRRALAQLRIVFDSRDGGARPSLALLVAVEPPTRSILVLGGLAVSTTTKFSLAAVAVGLLIFGTWFVLGGLGPLERNDDGGEDALKAATERLAPAPPELGGRPARAAQTPAPDAGARAEPWTCTFDTYDADESPHHWMGAGVQDRNGNTLQDISPETGPAYRGALKLRGSGYVVVWAHQRLPWRSEWLEPPPSGKRHLVVRFDAGLAISGTVFEQDGVTPLSSGTVDTRSFASSDPRRPVHSSRGNIVQKDGSFRILALPPGPVKLEAKAYDFTKGRNVRLDAQAGDDDLRLVLGPQGAIAFLIVDEATGFAPQTKSLRVFGVTGDEERVWTASTWSVPGEAREAKPSRWHRAEPGQTYRFRVEALGYEPSELVAVAVPVTGGKEVVPLALRSAPDSMARLTVTVRTAGGELPGWVYVRRYSSPGSSNSMGFKIEGGQIELELIPGPQHIEVARAPSPDPEDENTFWVPVEVKLTLLRGEERGVQVLLEKGGWAVFDGDPDLRPREVRLIRGEEVIERRAEWGPTGKKHESAYKLGVLPRGTWTLEYTDRKQGRRTKFDVEPGKVTRLDPKTFETFLVDGE